MIKRSYVVINVKLTIQFVCTFRCMSVFQHNIKSFVIDLLNKENSYSRIQEVQCLVIGMFRSTNNLPISTITIVKFCHYTSYMAHHIYRPTSIVVVYDMNVFIILLYFLWSSAATF